MGNRAVIKFAKSDQSPASEGLGVYLHWNGGVESVLAFAEATKERVGSVDVVGFVQTTTNFMGYDGYSVYVGPVSELDCDNYDNGMFELSASGSIVERKHNSEEDVAKCSADLDAYQRKGYEEILALCREQNSAIAKRS